MLHYYCILHINQAILLRTGVTYAMYAEFFNYYGMIKLNFDQMKITNFFFFKLIFLLLKER